MTGDVDRCSRCNEPLTKYDRPNEQQGAAYQSALQNVALTQQEQLHNCLVSTPIYCRECLKNGATQSQQNLSQG